MAKTPKHITRKGILYVGGERVGPAEFYFCFDPPSPVHGPSWKCSLSMPITYEDARRVLETEDGEMYLRGKKPSPIRLYNVTLSKTFLMKGLDIRSQFYFQTDKRPAWLYDLLPKGNYHNYLDGTAGKRR